MKNGKNKKQMHTAKVNGVEFVNAQNIKEPEKEECRNAENTENLIWLADKDNLEL